MSWINRLMRRTFTAETRNERPSYAVLHQPNTIIPGCLTAQVYLHSIQTQADPLSCWTYVSDGMRSSGQPEIVFTLLRLPDEPSDTPPWEPLDVFQTLFQLVQQGRSLYPGGYTQFGDRNFMGRHLIYVPTEILNGVPLSAKVLTALLVTKEEVEAAQAFGVTRVVSRLGWASRYYPCPPWSDRRRAGLPFEATFRHSLLSGVPSGCFPGVSVCQEDDMINVRLTESSAVSLQKALQQVSPTTPLSFVTEIYSGADACLVWEPGQTEPCAIWKEGTEGTHISGCFLMIVPEQEAEEVKLIEDGVALLLSRTTWSFVRDGLMKKRPMQIAPGDGRLPVRFIWT